MAKNVLPVDFQDDILSEDMDGRRKYQMITNPDGTVSFVDVTEYTQVGSNFGQAQINATNEAVNEAADKNKIIDSKTDLMANTQAGMMAGALAVKNALNELNENSIKPVAIGDNFVVYKYRNLYTINGYTTKKKNAWEAIAYLTDLAPNVEITNGAFQILTTGMVRVMSEVQAGVSFALTWQHEN